MCFDGMPTQLTRPAADRRLGHPDRLALLAQLDAIGLPQAPER
jgi:hypothetical protein